MSAAQVASAFSSEPIGEYTGSARKKRNTLLWALGLSGFGIVAIILGIIQPVPPKEPGGERTMVVAMSIIGGLFIAAGVVAFLLFTAQIMRKIVVYPEGFLGNGFTGTKVVRWSEVDEFVYWVQEPTISIWTTSGVKVQYGEGDIEREMEFNEAIVEQMSQALAAQIVPQLQAGETVNFGRIDATRDGLNCHLGEYKSPKEKSHYKGPWPIDVPSANEAKIRQGGVEEVSWEEFGSIQLGDDMNMMIVRANGHRLRLGCQPLDLPNCYALPAVAKGMRGE